MRAYCYTCQTDTLTNQRGACGFCDTIIITPHQTTGIRLGGHSYIGTEAFYRACYERYLEVRSIRKVAAEVWQQAGYASPSSCANTLHEVWLTRGWPTYQRGYSNTKHGKLRRDYRDPDHRRAQRRLTGEIRGVRCKATKKQAPGVGDPCKMYALKGSDYCRFHDPARRDQLLAETRRMRLAQGQQA